MDLIYYIALLKTPSVGPITFYKLLGYFEEINNIFTATAQDLRQCKLLNEKAIAYILQFDTQLVSEDIKWAEKTNNTILTFFDDDYPALLKNIYGPPPLLYVTGDVSLLSTQGIAIVGSRNPTTTGTRNAYQFAKELSHYLTITSGMAMGIDAYAHKGALENNGNTIAVCGTGLDRVYPAKNKHIAKSISETGALISEFSIGTQPHAQNFPKRNRILTGLSQGLLMVEGEIKSGSMVSAKLAIEQNKDVFAIPGSIHNPLTSGCHALIKECAYLVDNVKDIIDILDIHSNYNYTKTTNSHKEATQEDNVLLKYIDYDGLTINELVNKSGLDVSEVNNLIMKLELSSIIEKTIHNTYIRT